MALKQSRRARRMQRHHARVTRRQAFNLVSLMDIFTILVFFLLVNSTDVEVLPNPRAMTLPESVADQRAEETPVVMLAVNEVLLDGKPLVKLDKVKLDSSGEAEVEDIPALSQALEALRPDDDAETEDQRITLMADKAHPFSLIERAMRSCVSAGRPEINLAVLQKGDQG